MEAEPFNLDLTWECPYELDKCEALLLALCMRLHGTARAKADGTREFPPLGDGSIEVTLTADLAKALLPHFSYLRHKIRCSPFTFKEEHVAPLILGITKDEAQAEILQGQWSAKHQDIIEQARTDLAEICAAGFRCKG